MSSSSQESVIRRRLITRLGIFILSLMMVPGSPAVAQQQPDAQEILRQIQQGQIPQGVQPLVSLKGTWAYAVEPGMHTEMLKNQSFQDAKGIDADFLAKASVFVTRIQRGPDLCNPGQQGVSDMRVVAMQVDASATARAPGPRSRLIVNQQESLAMLDLHGEVREWKPSRNFCGGEKQMTEASRGDGRLVLEYQTRHTAPLNFIASPRPDNQPGAVGGSGFLSWDGGKVDLDVRAPAEGVPVATVNGPAQSVSISDALAMARELAGQDVKVPTAKEIESQLPEGMSLDALPITMTGNATGGPLNRWQTYEWTLAYVVQIEDAGEQVDDRWLHRGAAE